MPKKRNFPPNRYKEEILKVLQLEHFMSTAEIAHKLSMGYSTTLKYIEQLSNINKIKLKKIGNRRFWYL